MTTSQREPGWEHLGRTVERVVLRRLNRWQAEELREDLADLYVECFGAQAGEEYRDREGFIGLLVGDVTRPGFEMLIAEADALVGCVFGYPVERDGAWWEGFEGALPQNLEQLTASGHVFAVSEIMVHPHERHQGLADRLHAAFLVDQPASLAVTQVRGSDGPGLAAFRAWGWQEIGEIRGLSGSATLRVLVLVLGERTDAVPDGLAHNARTQRPGRSADNPSMPRLPTPDPVAVTGP